VSELDHSNPVAVCDVQLTQTDDYTVNGGALANAPDLTTSYVYDAYGRVTVKGVASNDGGATGSATWMQEKTFYLQNDTVAANGTAASGSYLIDFPVYEGIWDGATQTLQPIGCTT
jgi:hypothetical protein